MSVLLSRSDAELLSLELRYMVEHRQVVHRDISPSNLYLYVKSAELSGSADLGIPDHMLNPSDKQPTFINKLLDPAER
jgi:hypothetical protein